MEESMKRKQFLGFAVMTVAVIITLAGCDLSQNQEIPSEIRGTWRRENNSTYNNTITFTADTYQLSQQSYYWSLTDVSGNTYYFKPSTGGETKHKTLVLVNGKLQISGCGGTGIDNCNGTWIRQ